MVMVTARLDVPRGDPFDITPRARQLLAAERKAAERAAAVATVAARQQFRRTTGPRPIVESRPGRPSTEGNFSQTIQWRAVPGGVALDVASLPDYWLVQEIGTGKSARRIDGVASTSVSVKSQRGRILPRGLQFHTRSGTYMSPNAARRGRDQIVPVSDTSFERRRQQRTGRGPGATGNIQIRREIQGKHYLRHGGQRGFAVYRRELQQAGHQVFRKS